MTKDQVVHDLAMACVNGVVQDYVIRENKDFNLGISASDLAIEVITAYKDAWTMIHPQIEVDGD